MKLTQPQIERGIQEAGRVLAQEVKARKWEGYGSTREILGTLFERLEVLAGSVHAEEEESVTADLSSLAAAAVLALATIPLLKGGK